MPNENNTNENKIPTLGEVGSMVRRLAQKVADDYAATDDLGNLASKDSVSTSDLDSTLAQTINNKANSSDLNNKVDKVTGKGLSTKDYTGDAETVNSHTVNADVPANAKFTDTTYENATTTTAGLMSADDKTKLSGIDTNANNYVHPDYTAKDNGLYKVTVDNKGHVSNTVAVQKSDITALGIPSEDTTYNEATTSTAGLLSAADKTTIDNLGSLASKGSVRIKYKNNN